MAMKSLARFLLCDSLDGLLTRHWNCGTDPSNALLEEAPPTMTTTTSTRVEPPVLIDSYAFITWECLHTCQDRLENTSALVLPMSTYGHHAWRGHPWRSMKPHRLGTPPHVHVCIDKQDQGSIRILWCNGQKSLDAQRWYTRDSWWYTEKVLQPPCRIMKKKRDQILAISKYKVFE